MTAAICRWGGYAASSSHARHNGPLPASIGSCANRKRPPVDMKGADHVLRQLFEHQAELNRRIGFDPKVLRENFDPKVAGEWLSNYLAAMSNELEELRDCTYWKHWCKEAKEGRRFEIHDLQNARVEVIDMLFFWISLAQCLGLDADDVVNLYEQKLNVNHQRQQNGYSMTGKDESDNKSIDLKPRS